MAAQTVWSATYDLLRSLELTTVFGNPGSTGTTVPEELSRRFSIHPRPAGGLGRRDGGRVRPSHGSPGAGEPAHVGRHRQWHGQHHDGVPEQDAAHHHGRPADARNDPLRPPVDEPRRNDAAATLREVGLSAGARPGRAGRHHARIRHGAPTALGPGVRIDTARRLGSSLRSAPRPSARSASASRPTASACANSPSGSRLRRGSPSSTGRRSSGAAVGTQASRWRRSSTRLCSTRRSPSARPFPRRIACSRGCSRSPWGLWPPASTASIWRW